MSFASRLNRLRVKKNQSLQEVASAVGVSKTHIWELEKARSENPSLEMLTKLADHFGVTIRYLAGEAIESSEDEKLSKMFRQVGALEDNDRAILEDMVKGMLKRKREREAND